MRAALLVAAALPLAGCALTSNVPPVTPAMAGPGLSMQTLQAGRVVFGERCTACHRPYPLEKYTVPRWHELVATMSPRAKLAPPQTAALLAYIEAAKRTTP